jgi:transcriptional regulator with PAS, ATPase and Fis domain
MKSANGGTLFLDEIGEMSLEMQAKLLRALQQKEVKPVGSTERRPINVRIVAATNRDLDLATKNGSFRQDLYFRWKWCNSNCRRCGNVRATFRCW